MNATTVVCLTLWHLIQLKREALRAVGLATTPREAETGVTYGDLAAGTGRRVSVSPHV